MGRWSLARLVLGAVVVGVVAASLPDVKRYLRIKQM
jgi:hypothetical protein